MKYLETFTLASDRDEGGFLLSFPYQLEMQCYSHENVYPFKIFPSKGISRLAFEPITVLYGGNGSGKSTLLNVIVEKLGLKRSAPFNNTPFMAEYLKLCQYRLSFGKKAPAGSCIITSDDVFDYLLDIRAINEGVDRRREALFNEYTKFTDPTQPAFQMRSLDEYEELKRRNEARKNTKSAYVSKRLSKELDGKSNGESAFYYFTQQIGEDALYLLDEPENSLSARLQNELRQFIEDSARFYGCQFLISTHSPFLLSMKSAKIYDLDARPVAERRWTELEAVRLYYDLFESHRREFQ